MNNKLMILTRDFGEDEIKRLNLTNLEIIFPKSEKEILDKYYRIMPRTMLRYSLERLTKEQKYFYMGK